MPSFAYRVVNEEGRVTSGVGVADNQEMLLDDLRERGFHIIEVRPAKDEEPPALVQRRYGFSWEPFGVPEKAVVFFTRQLATTLKAGLPLLRAMSTLQQQTSSGGLRKNLGKVLGGLQQGKSMHECLAEHRGTFSDLYIAMVRVGEASGNLDVTVARLADILEKDMALRRKIRGALTYPVFVLCFSMIMCYGLIAFLLPGFTPIFESSGLNIRQDYPITQMLIEMSNAATSPYFFVTVPLLIVLTVVVVRLMSRSGGGRLVLDTAKFYFPFFHPLIQMTAIARFCRTFGLLVRSGVPLLEGLTLVGGAAGNLVVARSLQRVSADLQKGARIAPTLAKVALFPPLMVQMVAVGEETAALDTMFERVAEYYEQELEVSVAALTALIEPGMMILVGIVVCFFVLGVLLPIMGISAAYQKQI